MPYLMMASFNGLYFCYATDRLKMSLGLIMATITFDTHKFVLKLQEAGFDQKQVARA